MQSGLLPALGEDVGALEEDWPCHRQLPGPHTSDNYLFVLILPFGLVVRFFSDSHAHARSGRKSGSTILPYPTLWKRLAAKADMNILGISCYYHDAAAALLQDGQLIAASEEERFSRIKHDFGFPRQAINFCLESGGIKGEDLDYAVFYEKPFRKFDRILMSVLQTYPQSYKVFRESMITWMIDKLWVGSKISAELGIPTDKILYCEHHMSHAASAFLCSPFEEAAVLTVDGVGEWVTGTWGVGRGNQIDISKQMMFPHSLGLAVQRVHGVPRVRSQRGRIQSNGHGAVRPAALRRQGVEVDPAGSGRLVLARHGLLLLPALHRRAPSTSKL